MSRRLTRRITIYRFRAMNADGEIRQSRMYAFLPPTKRQAAYWIKRGCEVSIERSTEPVEWTQLFRWKP